MTKSKFNQMRVRIRSSEAYKIYCDVTSYTHLNGAGYLDVEELQTIPLIGVKRVEAPRNRKGIEFLTEFHFIGKPSDKITRVSLEEARKKYFVGNITALNIHGSHDDPSSGIDEFYGDVFMGFREMLKKTENSELPTTFTLTSILTNDWSHYKGPSFTNARFNRYYYHKNGDICVITLLRD